MDVKKDEIDFDLQEIFKDISAEYEESEESCATLAQFKPLSFEWNLVQQLSHEELECYLRNQNIIDSEQIIINVLKAKGNEYLILNGYDYDQYYIHAVVVEKSNHIKFASIGAFELDAGSKLHITDIKVDIRDANRGYGSILLQQFIKTAIKNKVRIITGELTPEDIRSHGERLKHFYIKNGFEIEDFGHYANIKWINPNLLSDIEED